MRTWLYPSLLSATLILSCQKNDEGGGAKLKAGPQGIGYFIFASDAKVVETQNFQSIQNKIEGKIMIGGDPGYPDISDEFVDLMKLSYRWNTEKHVYLEGPGGPTGEVIAEDECQRMMARAESVDITIDRQDCSEGSQWLSTWNDSGWYESTRKEITSFHQAYAISSIEIDNLYRAGIDDSKSLVAFFKRLSPLLEEKSISIVLKNPTVDDFEALGNAIQSSALSRAIISDFAISEEFYKKDWKEIKAASRALDITTLTSSDTQDYQAIGPFEEE